MTPRAAAPARPIYRPIRTAKEFEETVNELDYLADMDPKEGTPAYDRMELLGILIAAYEEAHLPPLEPATPQELVQFMAGQKEISSPDLAELLGGRSRLSEFLNGTRDLSKTQIMRVRDALGIPADLLLGDG